MTEPRKSMEPYLKDEVVYYDYQIEGIRTLAHMNSFILADEMGLGKSVQALTVFLIDVVRKWANKAIVICPVTLKGNWGDEIEKFTRVNYMILGQEDKNGKTVQLGPQARSAQIAKFLVMDSPKILITNYEQIQPHLKELNQCQFDISIFDEAHYMKNFKAQRTKACLKLYSKRSFLLTGTPMLNNVNELWTLLHRIDPKYFSSYWAFVQRYCVFGGYQNKQIIAPKNEKELRQKLQRYMVRRLQKDVLNLKEPQIIERRVDLSKEQRELYDEVINDLRMTDLDGNQKDIENALTKFLRLKQICATTFPFTGIDKSMKLDLVTEDIQELTSQGHKVIVFTQFRAVIECMEKRLAGLGISTWQLHGGVPTSDRQGIVKSWGEDSSSGVILCMLQVAGIGLNMTASKRLLFVDELFVPGLNKQAIYRSQRIGQDETTAIQVYKYITRNTIENRIQQILRSKTKLNDAIVESNDWLRRLMKAVMEDD